MDNDYKINKEKPKSIHNEVMLFLGDELTRIHQETNSQSYDIEKEYAKTKNNKTFFTTIVLVSTFLVVIGIAWGLTAIIAKHDKEVTVSLAEFDDLNLKGLLDSVSKVQNQYDDALKNKMNLENDLDTLIRAADNKYDNDIFIIDSMNIRSKSEREKRVNAAKTERRNAVAAAHEQYDSQIALAEKELAEYKAQLEEYNTTKIESAKEKERLLDSERQLRELQEKELTSKYEARITELEYSIQELRNQNSENMRKSVTEVAGKYIEEINALDPVIKDEEADEYILEVQENPTPDYDAETALEQKEIKNPRMVKFYNEYQDLYDSYLYFDDVVAGIPQKNSIPSYVATSHDLVNQMSVSFVEVTSLLHDENVEYKAKIDKLNREIETVKSNAAAEVEQSKNDCDTLCESLMNATKAQAVILSADSADSIVIYVAPSLRKSISEAGVEVEFKAGKTVKGKIVPQKDGNYLFTAAPDKDGKPTPVDMSKVILGTVVKLTIK